MKKDPPRRILKAIFELEPEDCDLPVERRVLSKSGSHLPWQSPISLARAPLAPVPGPPDVDWQQLTARSETLAVPTLDERVDIYSRAVHGSDYSTTPQERAAVRRRIMESMADAAVHRILDDAGQEFLEEPQVQVPEDNLTLAARIHETCAALSRRTAQWWSETTSTLSPAYGVRVVAVAFTFVLVGGAAVWMTPSVVFHPSNDTGVQVARAPEARDHTAVLASQERSRNTGELPVEEQVARSAREIDAAKQRLREAQGFKTAQESGRAAAAPVAAGQPVALPVPALADQPIASPGVLQIKNKYEELLAVGNYDAALLEAQKLEAEARAQFREDDPRLAGALGPLAQVYLAERRYAEAEAVFKQILAIRKRTFGLAHPDMVRTLNGLADVYRAQGRIVEAEELVKQASSIQKSGVQPR